MGDSSQYPKHIQTRIQRQQALGEQRLRSGLAGYLGNLAFLDLCVGQVYKSLEELGLIDNTIVIYTSDHGDMLWSQNQQRKQRPWEESARVPMLFRVPASSNIMPRRLAATIRQRRAPGRRPVGHAGTPRAR